MFNFRRTSIIDQSKTDAEMFVESPSNLAALMHPHVDPIPSSTMKSTDGVTIGGSLEKNHDKILLNFNEAKSILQVDSKNEDDEQKKKEGKVRKWEADEGRFWSIFPCIKCAVAGHKGILKGLRRSIPNKRHIIEHWRKQLMNRINKKKSAIIVDGNTSLNISYMELDQFSNCIAHNLKQLKFSGNFENHNPNGEIVIAVCHPACYEYVVVMLAVLKLGAALLPISVELPPERISEIIKLTRPVLMIASSQDEDLFEEVVSMAPVDIMYIDDIWTMLASRGGIEEAAHSFRTPIESPNPKNPYPPMWKRTVAISIVPSDTQEIQALSYDSRAIYNRIKWENHFFIYFSSEYVLLPPHFVNVDSVAEVLTALVVGVTLVAYQSSTDVYIPEQLFSYCQTYKLRRLTLWPSLLKACTTAMQLFDFYLQQVRTVRYWFCVGGSIRTELAEVFFELVHPLAQLVHMYQFEDCAGAVTFQTYETLVHTKERSFHSRLPVGYPVPNMDIYVLDSNLQPVKDGEIGEIYITGVQLPRINKLEDMNNNYYMKNPFSNHKDRKFMVRTMDVGRIKTKSNGTRVLVHETTRSRHFYIDNEIVWLQNIEMYLSRLTHLVKGCHCVCYRPNEDDQLILAFCETANTKTTAAEIEDELRNCLSLHTVPEVFVIKKIPKFPDTGLTDENALLQIYQEQRLKRQDFDDWDKLNLPDQYVGRAAKILCYVMYTYLGVPIKFLVENCWNSQYLAIRRSTVTKAAFIVKELHKNRYPIFIDDFIYAESLGAIAELMVDARKERGFYKANLPMANEVAFTKNSYKLEIMVNGNRTQVCGLLGRCFTQRGQLDYYAEVNFISMRKYFDVTWPIYVSKKLSVVIRRKREKYKMVGAVLNINWHDEIKLTSTVIAPEVGYKLELIHYLETGLTDAHFPQNKTHVMQICYVGLDTKVLSDTEIHGLTDKIIRTMLAFGKIKGFEAIVFITYDYFSLDICVNNYGFHVAKQCQANEFMASDGTKPYALCPDTLIASMTWKLFSKVADDNYRAENPHHHNYRHPQPSDKHNRIIGLINEHQKPWSSFST